MTDFTTEEDRAFIDAICSDFQTEGVSMAASIDPDWFFEDTGNEEDRMDRLMLFMLRYFPTSFKTWEPINHMFYRHWEYVNKGLILLPGQHGKSTMISRGFIWIIAQEPNISCIYTEKNAPTACKRSRAMRMLMQENELLKHDFGIFQPEPSSIKPWSDENWTVRQRTEMIDWPTMAVFGAGGGSALGNRCNIIVNDDPVTPENSRSDLERGHLWQWHSEAASTCPVPLPIKIKRYLVKEFLVGTVFRRDDLFHRVRETGDYEELHLPAVIDEVKGTTLSPRYCYIEPDELARRAKVDEYYESMYEAVKNRTIKNLHAWAKTHGRTAFNRRFQNVALNAEDQWCKEEWIRGGGANEPHAPSGGWPGCLDTDRAIGSVQDGWLYVTGCDPQGGKKNRHNARFAALTLAAHPKDPTMRYIVDIDCGQYPLESDNPHVTTQTGLLLRHATKYRSKVIIESNAQQSGWQGVLKKAAKAKGVVVSVEGHFTDAKKDDPDIGVQGMASLFENGYMRFPYANVKSQRMSDMLIDELLYWGVHPTSDIAMALWFANNRIERMLKASKAALHNQGVDRPYVNQLVRTRYPQHWTKEMIESYEEEKQQRDDEIREAETVVSA